MSLYSTDQDKCSQSLGYVLVLGQSRAKSYPQRLGFVRLALVPLNFTLTTVLPFVVLLFCDEPIASLPALRIHRQRG